MERPPNILFRAPDPLTETDFMLPPNAKVEFLALPQDIPMDQVIHSKALASGGIFMAVSAALHVAAPLVTGFAFSPFLLLAVGLGYFGIARSLLAGSDLWAKATLVVMALGIPGALLMIWLGAAVPHWWLWPIVWTDAAVVLSLGIFVFRRDRYRSWA